MPQSSPLTTQQLQKINSKAAEFMLWFVHMVDRAENQGIKIEPLSQTEIHKYT